MARRGEAVGSGEAGAGGGLAVGEPARPHRALLRFHGEAGVPHRRVLEASARILDGAEAGDRAALAAAAEAAQHLGTGLASLVNLFDPDRVVLGGTLARLWRLLPEEISSRVAARAFLERLGGVPIHPAGLAEAPCSAPPSWPWNRCSETPARRRRAKPRAQGG